MSGSAPSVNVTAGAFRAVPAFETQQLTLVPSGISSGTCSCSRSAARRRRAELAALVEQFGPFTPAVSCTVEAGKFGSGAGTVLRCSAFEIAAVTTGQGGNPNPELGVALRGAPQIPRGGGWSMGVRRYTDQAPAALPNDFPVPVVQNNNDTSRWHIADVADLDSLAAARQLLQPAARDRHQQGAVRGAADPGGGRAGSRVGAGPAVPAAAVRAARRGREPGLAQPRRPGRDPQLDRPVPRAVRGAVAADPERAAADRHDPVRLPVLQELHVPGRRGGQPEHDDDRRSRRHHDHARLRGHHPVAADAGAARLHGRLVGLSQLDAQPEDAQLPGHRPGVRLGSGADHHRRVLRRREHQARADQPRTSRSAARCRPCRPCSATCRPWPPTCRAGWAPTWTSRSRTGS